jgi:hypothetical protein
MTPSAVRQVFPEPGSMIPMHNMPEWNGDSGYSGDVGHTVTGADLPLRPPSPVIPLFPVMVWRR